MEEEVHPFIHLGEAIPGNKMVVGTFPVYTLTSPETAHKLAVRHANDVHIFYGSHRSQFRSWYQTYVDPEVDIFDPDSLWNSWANNGIAISDVIISAFRNGGANDNGLAVTEWNLGLANIIEDRIDKIICTSKSQTGAMGRLIQHILEPHGFVHNPIESAELQNHILNQIPGAHQNFKNSIAKVLTLGSKRVEIIAIPSPGSPFRQLHNYGYGNGIQTNVVFLDQYLSTVFEWFQG
ncbi:MAG: hypothetical protein ACQEW9_04945 [Bacteroidota bacterium]